MAWMAVNSSLNTVAQTALPAWVRARALSVYLLVFQGAMALGQRDLGRDRLTLWAASHAVGRRIALIAGAVVTFRLRLVGAHGGGYHAVLALA